MTGGTATSLPDPIEKSARETLAAWDAAGGTQRLWSRDATLWTGGDEASWLGWLDAPHAAEEDASRLRGLTDDVRASGYTRAVLLGMGGSSLCAEVLRTIHGRRDGFPDLAILDSTDPGQISRLESVLDPTRTLFIVSSKSGSTLEPNILMDYFFDRVRSAVGPDRAGDRFLAVTDPGSKLEAVARERRFRSIFPGIPSVGGRFSALTHFGMVPASIMGIDAVRLLADTEPMVRACGVIPSASNPGVYLGAILAVCAAAGRDKVTFLTSPELGSLGAWLEQLLAESTGKRGKALIPVDGEPIADPDRYGADRLFVRVALEGDADPRTEAHLAQLESAGHPVVRIGVAAPALIGQEFYRWEFATAVAGALMGINPFDQPDVEANKVETRRLTDAYEKSGALPELAPIAAGKGMRFYADPANAAALREAGGDASVEDLLSAHLGRTRPGDYLAILAYLDPTDEAQEELARLRRLILESRRAAVCLGYGPRFLHSTGQAYKGGPNSGVFLQITSDDPVDLPVPDRKFTFGVVKAAQAQGDFEVLARRGRRALGVHIEDPAAGLAALCDAAKRALR